MTVDEALTYAEEYKHAHPAFPMDWQTIHALAAEVRRLREENADLQEQKAAAWRAWEGRVQQLARVEALPAKWRSLRGYDDFGYAPEDLESALRGDHE